MRTKLKVLFFAAAALMSCVSVSYTGVSRHESKIYLTGSTTTTFLFFTAYEPWVKRCTEEEVAREFIDKNTWTAKSQYYWVPGLRCIMLTEVVEQAMKEPVAQPTIAPRSVAPTPSAASSTPPSAHQLPQPQQPTAVHPPDPFVAVPFECAEWAELLCTCNARDIAVRD